MLMVPDTTERIIHDRVSTETSYRRVPVREGCCVFSARTLKKKRWGTPTHSTGEFEIQAAAESIVSAAAGKADLKVDQGSLTKSFDSMQQGSGLDTHAGVVL
mmetsp:Transcript_83769/g.167767  ORF Transcript_83769/g.167767 Transcript_83769/m.167767 type:complete len:102 (+) Transcript_83769:283-588(+)